MPPLNNASSSGSEEDDLSASSFSDDRDDFRETKSVAPAVKGTKEKAREEQRGSGEAEPSSLRSSSSAAAASASAVTSKTKPSSSSSSHSSSSSSSGIWVPPALLPIEGVPRLDLPIQAPVSTKAKKNKEREEDVFERLSAGLDALEAAVDAAAAGSGGSKKAASAPSSRHLVDALVAAGAIPTSAAKSKASLKVLPSLPGLLDAERGVGLAATAADFAAWLDAGEEAERQWVSEQRGGGGGKKADLGADDDDAAALPRQAARDAARRWLRETHGASLAEEARAAAAAAAAAAQEEEGQGEDGDDDGERPSFNGLPAELFRGRPPKSKGFELVPGLGSAKKLLGSQQQRGDGGDGGDGGDDDGDDSYGGRGGGRSFQYGDDEDEDGEGLRRGLGRRLVGAAGAVGGAVGGAVSAPLRLVFRRRGRKKKSDGGGADEAPNLEIRYSSPLLGSEMEGEAPLPSSKLTRAQRRALGPARLALLVAREKAARLAARDAREAAAWRAKQRKLEALRTRSYAQRAADETAKLAEEALLGGPPPASLSDEEDAAGRAELPQDEFAKRPTPTTVVREPAFAAGRRLDRTSREARPSGVKPAMAPSVLEREFAGRLSLSLFGRGIFGVPEGSEAAASSWASSGEDFFEGTAEARSPLARFLPPQLRPSPPLVGFGVYARPGSVAKFLGREHVEEGSGGGESEDDDGDFGETFNKKRQRAAFRESRWAAMPPLKAVQDPLFYADLARVAPEIGLTVVAWVPRPLPAAALARALGEAAAANAAAAAAAAFRDDLALRRRALAAGALPPLPSPADVVDYSEGVGGDDYDYGGGGQGDEEGGGEEDYDDDDDEEGGRRRRRRRRGGAGEGGRFHNLGPSWPCLRAGKLAERAARGAAHQLASAAEAAARATAAHEAALSEVAELRRRRAAARTAAFASGSGPGGGGPLSGRLWRRLAKELGVRASSGADKVGTSEMGTALPRPALPDSAFVVDRGVFEGSLPEKKKEEKEKKKKEDGKKKKKKNGKGRDGPSSSSDSDDDEFSRFNLDGDDDDPDLIVIPEGEPWIDAQGNIRPGSKLIFSAAPGGGLVVEALPPSRGFRDDARAAMANGGVPPPPQPKNPFLSPLVDAWKKFGGIPVDPAEDPTLAQPSTDDARRAKLVACCGPGSASALLGALLGPKAVDPLARARVGQRAAFELHAPEAEAEAVSFLAGSGGSGGRSSSSPPSPSLLSSTSQFDPARHNLSMTWLASLDARGVRESMPAMVDSIDAATAPFTLPLLPPPGAETDDGIRGRGKSCSPASTTSSSFYRRAAPPTLLRGVSAAAAFARRRAFPRRQEEEEDDEEEEAEASWGEDDDYEDEEDEDEERI